MNTKMRDSPMWSRREFAAGSLKAAIGAGAFPALLPGAAAAAPAAHLRFGLATYEWGRDWDIPTIIANLTKAGVRGVELKTLIKYANGRQERYPHGVELELSASGRAEARKRFADSPVTLVSLASSEHFPWPDPDQDKAAVEAVKGYLQLSHDVGAGRVRVLPNDWLPAAPHEKTLERIADALNQVGGVAADLGQEVDLEAHSAPGSIPNMKFVLDRVKYRGVRIRLNSELRNTVDPGFEQQFAMIKDRVARVMHIHNLKAAKYPYQQVIDVLTKAGWDGWALLEVSDKVPDRVAALSEQREIWESMVAKARVTQQS